MQNNTNEQQYNNNKYTNSNSVDESNMEVFNNDLQLSILDNKESQKGQVDNNGSDFNNFYINQNDKKDIKNNIIMIENYNANTNNNLNKDNGKLINKINLFIKIFFL